MALCLPAVPSSSGATLRSSRAHLAQRHEIARPSLQATSRSHRCLNTAPESAGG